MSRKIRVLFDANPLVRQKAGVGFYTEGVIRALAAIPELELIGHYFAPRRQVPKLPKADSLSYTHNSWLAGRAIKALRKCGIRLPWELLARRRADVLFFPDITTWPSLFKTPKVVTIHDLAYIDYPQFVRKRNLMYLRRYVQRDARRANLVLTISEFSKGRLIKEFKLLERKILVQPIPPPKPGIAAKGLRLPANFILFIGTIEPRKNLGGLVTAYEQLPPNLRAGWALVIAGGQGWDSGDIIKHIKSLQARGINIVTMGYVDEPTRAALYTKATIVVVPSFYEGFGMPVLEAMSYGTPVAVSDLAVFRETAGSAALYFDPSSTASIKNALIKILADATLRRNQVKKFPALLERYDWQEVAAHIYQGLERLANR